MRNQYFFTVESVGIEFQSRNVLGTRRKRRAKCRHICADCCWKIVRQCLRTSLTSVLLPPTAHQLLSSRLQLHVAQPARWPYAGRWLQCWCLSLRSISIFFDLPPRLANGSRQKHHMRTPRLLVCVGFEHFTVPTYVKGFSWLAQLAGAPHVCMYLEKIFFSNFCRTANRAVYVGIVEYSSAFQGSKQRVIT